MLLASALVFAYFGRVAPIVINQSARFASPREIMPSPDVDRPAILVKGDGLTIDFGNRIIRGTPHETDPDKREGTCIQIQGNNVTIKNARVSGYKVAVLAKNCNGLKLDHCDFSYNWKQHLHSTPEKEDESDWMSYHQNEKEEWLHTYAAAVYLEGCDGFEVKDVIATGGQCGLMMTQCNHGLVWNCTFSFLSGIGVGLYRSSDNRIMHNKIDWCVRGHSEGVYNRGQDSAGILVYEQSNRNTFAYNSVTQGGDGFFLWAGQSTMDTGQGGCNDNLVYGNDFSSAPTNGIEATFSRNAFLNNKVVECWHGVWGGYSFDTKIEGNAFSCNGEAISIEHGQNNTISQNTFWRDNDAIGLWANGGEDPNWGYPKHRDTKSRDYSILDNYFGNIPGPILSVRNTAGLDFERNRVEASGPVLKTGADDSKLKAENNTVRTSDPATASGLGDSNRITTDPASKPLSQLMQPSGLLMPGADPDPLIYAKRFDVTWSPFGTGEERRKDIETLAPQPLKGAQDPFLKPDQPRGRRYILIDEWGPYDFKRPLIVATNPKTVIGGTQKFSILGPKGKWRILHVTGAVLGAQSGEVPGAVDVSIPAGPAKSVDIELEYTGGETTDYRGIATRRGTAVRFSYEKYVLPIDWVVRFYKWGKSTDPSDPHAAPDEATVQAILKTAPLKELRQSTLDFAGSAFDPVTGNDHFLTTAEGTFSVDGGDYQLDLTTDDGARLWLDGNPIIEDAWHYQGPTTYSRTVHLSAGSHVLRVEHFQIDGYAALKVDLKPKK